MQALYRKGSIPYGQMEKIITTEYGLNNEKEKTQKEIASSIDSIGILLDILTLPHTLQIILFLSSLRYTLSERYGWQQQR